MNKTKKIANLFVYALTLFVLLNQFGIVFSHKKKVLFAFISVGENTIRNEVMRQNMELVLDLKKSTTKYIIECSVFVRVKLTETPKFVHEAKNWCHVVYLYRATINENLNFLHPPDLQRDRFQYLVVSLDDVAFYPPFGNVNLENYLDLVDSTSLAMSSPSILGSPHEFMHEIQYDNLDAVGHTVPFVEIQFTTFTIQSWTCIHEFTSSGLNITFTWYDVFFTSDVFLKDKDLWEFLT